jgi:antitoxin Phd
MNGKNWSVQDAKARFSELLDACVHDGPQVITRRAEPIATLVPMAEWERLSHAARPSLKALLLSGVGRAEISRARPVRRESSA